MKAREEKEEAEGWKKGRKEGNEQTNKSKPKLDDKVEKDRKDRETERREDRQRIRQLLSSFFSSFHHFFHLFFLCLSPSSLPLFLSLSGGEKFSILPDGGQAAASETWICFVCGERNVSWVTMCDFCAGFAENEV